jgi:tetraacyldisaccharide 4'-kinase
VSPSGPRIEAWFLRQWQDNGPAQLFLRPVSWLFGFLASARRFLFRIGVFRRIQVGRPVIVVGNISVGGTGKTPLVIGIVERLQAAGIKAGVVTRGYRRDGSPDGHAKHSEADEAMLISRRTGVPVVAMADRAAACAQMIAHHPEVQVIVSDDGLQHYRLERDVEICLIDGARGLGNGALLPAGPLREPPARLKNVDAIVVNRTASNLGGSRFAETHSSAPTFAMTYADESFANLVDETMDLQMALEQWRGKRLCAMAGIGHPQRFFSQLARLGFQCDEQRALPDHYAFAPADIHSCTADIVLVTEKDAVKLARFASELNKPVWALRVSAQLPPGFDEFLLARARALIAAHVH